MFKKPLFWDLFWIICLIAFLHQVAVQFYLYWVLPRFDVPMHFLGGFWIGLTALWVYYISDWGFSFFHKTNKTMLFATCLTVLTVGLGWEVFEYSIGLTTVGIADQIDTTKDIIMDLIGAVSAFLYFKYRLKEKNK